MNKPRLMLLAGAALLVVTGAAMMVLRNAGPGMAPGSASREHDAPAVQGTAVTPTPSATSVDGEAPMSVDASPVPSAPDEFVLPPDLPPLPPIDQPFAQQIAALSERASAGDATAACRLTVEAARCDQIMGLRATATMAERGGPAQMSNVGKEMMIEMSARAALAIERDGGHCDAVEQDQLRDVDRVLSATAKRFTVRQKVVLVMLRNNGTLARTTVPPDMTQGGGRSSSMQFVPQFYSDYTIPFLEEGVRAGELLALEGKVLLHQPSTLPNEIFGLRMTWPDQYRFALYSRALLELNGAGALNATYLGVLDPVLAAMSAAQRGALDADVAKLVTEIREARQRYKTAPLSERAGLAELCAS
jgi:hypothetical protein